MLNLKWNPNHYAFSYILPMKMPCYSGFSWQYWLYKNHWIHMMPYLVFLFHDIFFQWMLQQNDQAHIYVFQFQLNVMQIESIFFCNKGNKLSNQLLLQKFLILSFSHSLLIIFQYRVRNQYFASIILINFSETLEDSLLVFQ